ISIRGPRKYTTPVWVAEMVERGFSLLRIESGSHQHLGLAIRVSKGIRIPLLVLGILFLATDVHAQPRDPNRIRTVVLDAGHGGKDPGNLGTGRYKTTEKHVSLNVAKLIGKYINESFPDVKVIYTRDNDTFIELKERCNIANAAKADVF